MNDTVFLDYDRESLDREYNNRAKVADAEGYLARYSQASDSTRDTLGGRLNITYGSSAAEVLDVFSTPHDGAAVQVFFHGGYWKALSKDDFSFVANGFVSAGAITVVIEYALMPSVNMDELIRQCRASLGWVWRNAADIGGDPDRIFVSGHSAGGHIVAMMMATDWPAFDNTLPADLVKGACGISGLYDLEPVRLCYLNDELKLDEATVARNSPVRLTRHSSGPLLLAVGGLEGPEYLRQTNALAQAWRARGSAPEIMVMARVQHFSIVEQLNDATSELSREIQRQMGLG